MRASLQPLSGSPASRHRFRSVATWSRPRSTTGSSAARRLDGCAGGHGHAAFAAEFQARRHVVAVERRPPCPAGRRRAVPAPAATSPQAALPPRWTRRAARAWSISICIRPRSERTTFVRSSSGVSGTVSGVLDHMGSASATRSWRTHLPGLRVGLVFEDLLLAVAAEVGSRRAGSRWRTACPVRRGSPYACAGLRSRQTKRGLRSSRRPIARTGSWVSFLG